jgi:NADPH:quinone reductase-like Zn-dependent oxidoreductase
MPSEKNVRVLVTAKGGPEVLKLVDEDLPEPQAGQVRVCVLAAGVAFADILIRRGLYPGNPPFPLTPGYDVVGDIDALGQNVEGFSVGQRVAALTMTGGYSRFTIVPAADLVAVPDGLDPSEAVCLVVNYVTAYQMLHRLARLNAGQKFLVHSAAGGVGTAALQLGKVAKLEAFGTASKAKLGLVSAQGAVAIDYHAENFADRIRQLVPDGLDCVLDAVGGTHWWASYRCLRRGGILLCYGAQVNVSGGTLAAGLGFALFGLMTVLPDGKRVRWYNSRIFRDQHRDWFREDLTILFELLLARSIEPVIAREFPLRDAARANEMLEKGEAAGKLILLPQT